MLTSVSSDRFVYLLQALSSLTQQILVRAGEDVTDQRTSSIGLVVKQFCNRQVQLNTVVQQTMSDVSQSKHSSVFIKDFNINVKFIMCSC